MYVCLHAILLPFSFPNNTKKYVEAFWEFALNAHIDTQRCKAAWWLLQITCLCIFSLRAASGIYQSLVTKHQTLSNEFVRIYDNRIQNRTNMITCLLYNFNVKPKQNTWCLFRKHFILRTPLAVYRFPWGKSFTIFRSLIKWRRQWFRYKSYKLAEPRLHKATINHVAHDS